MKKMLSILLAVLMLSLCAGALAEGTLLMGTNAAFPPFEFVNDDGSYGGFDVDVATLIAAELGMELQVEDMAFDGLITALSQGKIDMAMAGMTITDERKEQVNFATPYLTAQQQVIVRKDYDEIKTLDDLSDKLVAVQDGTTGHIMVQDLGLPDSQIAAFKAGADAILELKAGRADAVVIDTEPAKVFVELNDDLVILDGIETPLEEYAIAINKENTELLDNVNAALEKVMASDEYAAILDKYFPQDK